MEAQKEVKRLSKGYILSFVGGVIIIACGLMLAISGIGSYSGALVILFAILGGVLLLSGIMVVRQAIGHNRAVIIFSILSLLFSIFPTTLGIGSSLSWRPQMGDRTFYIFLSLLGSASMIGSILGTVGGLVLMKEKRARAKTVRAHLCSIEKANSGNGELLRLSKFGVHSYASFPQGLGKSN